MKVQCWLQFKFLCKLRYMFCCCGEREPQQGFQVVRMSQDNESLVSYVPNVNNIDKKITEDKNVKIRPVKKSQYTQLFENCKKYNKKFTDQLFSPNNSSLGVIQGLQKVKVTWKRISEFVTKPTLFCKTIEPKDVVQTNKGDCFLLSAIAALAENPEVIKTIFHGQEYNVEGIYRVMLYNNGVIQQVIVDDFIPLNDQNLPIFCQTTQRQDKTQFWTLILQKALGKLKGSYSGIMKGLPSHIFRAVTYSPAQTLDFAEKDKERVWHLMQSFSGFNEPFCATTKNFIEYKSLGIIPVHTYSVLAVAKLTINELAIGSFSTKRHERIVKLRNPWAKQNEENWTGKGSLKDHELWNNCQKNAEYSKISRQTAAGDYGLFYMTFDEFFKNFSSIHYCNFHHSGKTITEKLFVDKHHSDGAVYQIKIPYDGSYTFQLSQSAITYQSVQQKQQQGICRASLMLIQHANDGKFYYRGGIMRSDEDHLLITLDLKIGNYILYAHLDPTITSHLLPDQASVSVHSSVVCGLSAIPSTKYPNIIRETFMNDGLKYEKKILQNNGLMSITYRLLFQEGGFAYIFFNNDAKSDKMFRISYDVNQFAKSDIQLIEPTTHNKNFDLEVSPGKSMILIARAINKKVDKWKFPPNMNVRIDPLF